MFEFGEFSNNCCYIINVATGEAVDTFYCDTLTLYSGKKLSEYNLEY